MTLTRKELLEAAQYGLQQKIKVLLDQQAAINDELLHGVAGGRLVNAIPITDGRRKKRVVSPEARKRMALAQKKRWAAYHANRKSA